MQQVMADTGLSRATIYRLMEAGEFPQSVKIGLRAVAWPSSEVQEWIQAAIAKGRAA